MPVEADRLVTMSETPDSAVRTHTDRYRAAFLGDLAERLRIPSVSARSEHAPDVRRSADRPAARLGETGFPAAGVRPTPGAPPVFAELPFDEERGLRTTKSTAVHGEAGYTALERPPEPPARPTAEAGRPWASPRPSTAGTSRTRRSNSTCCSRASGPAHTCGTTWGRTGAVNTDRPAGRTGRRARPGARHTGRTAPYAQSPPDPVASRRTSC
jgi:hypothetical protein